MGGAGSRTDGFFIPSSCFQEAGEPRRQQEEGQPEGAAAPRPVDPPRGDGDEEHGEGPERGPLRTRLPHPVLPGPPAGGSQPIREPDWQQEQPLRFLLYVRRFLLKCSNFYCRFRLLALLTAVYC